MLLKRLLTAGVGIPFAIYVVNIGGMPFYLVISLLALGGIFELIGMFRRTGFSPSPAISSSLSLLIPAVAYLGNADEMGFLLAVLIVGCLVTLIVQKNTFSVPDAAVTIFITLYAGGLFSFLIFLRNISFDTIITTLGGISAGVAFTWLALLATWANDTSAYFVGTALGKHKLCPEISPGKTIEGAVGGMAGSIILFAGLGTLVQISLPHGIMLGLLTGISGILGDLAESVLKRFAGVKDSGRAFPGHGGILDRFDSILFVAPAVYFYLKFFIVG